MRVGAGGDDGSFESLLRSVLSRAYSAALHLTGTASDAEDLVQEAALLAWKGFAGFQAGTNFRAWFLRILTNAFYMRVRRARRTGVTVSLDATSEQYLPQSISHAHEFAGAADGGETFLSRLATEEIAGAIRALPMEYRTVASLYFVEDMSYLEIAHILDCPVGTVRSRLHRGRKMLRSTLWRIARDHGIV